MKKLWKKGTALALAVIMAAALAACGGSTGASSTGSSGGEAKSESAAAIKIGGSGPLTGPAAVYGLAVKNAAEMAVEEVNAKGGLQFELQFEDDKHDKEEASNAYSSLVDSGMQISLLTVTTGPGEEVAPRYKEDQIFAITPSGSGPSVIYADGANMSGEIGRASCRERV